MLNTAIYSSNTTVTVMGNRSFEELHTRKGLFKNKNDLSQNDRWYRKHNNRNKNKHT